MRIQFRYFAMVREIVGQGHDTKDIPAGTTAGGAFDALVGETPRLAPLRGRVMLMVNREYVTSDHVLTDDDELALIPPVSGGAGDHERRQRFVVTDEILDARAIEARVASPGAGAIVTFTGTVRDNARGKGVVALEYEAYPEAAEAMLVRIGDEIREQWGIDLVAISHRTGYLTPGVASVVIAVASAHRGEAFAACSHAIERIKEIVPIWKKEFYEDGAIWVGSESEYQRETGRVGTPPV